ncbi:hypothetical protein, partial [Neisseria viridiae]|uniref:hypothetical protein n=2 Tax=Neisseria viridiae TaxID=2830648 RepID=UPI00272D65B8
MILILLGVARDISKPAFSSVSSTSARLFTLPARARASKPSVMLCAASCVFLGRSLAWVMLCRLAGSSGSLYPCVRFCMVRHASTLP